MCGKADPADGLWITVRSAPGPGTLGRMQPTTSRDGERGHALSAFVVVVVIALLLISGLVIDGGRRSAATREAELTAAAAARAAVDATAAQRQAGRRPDAGQALAAAREVLAGSPGLQGSVVVRADGSIEVTTSTSVETVLLSLIGITRLNASGSASAQLFE